VVRDREKIGPSDLQRGHWYSIVEYIKYIGLMIGQIESESCIRQNACSQEVTQSRDATVNLIETRGLVQKRKTVPKACKIGLYPPNCTSPVNNTVKKEELTRKTRNCLLDGFVNETQFEYQVSERILVSKRIVNRMGSEDL
jgi:hypothetical protein